MDVKTTNIERGTKFKKFTQCAKNCICHSDVLQNIAITNRITTYLILIRHMSKKLNENKLFLINEVSRQVGLSQKRIREYEKGGLIKPVRQEKTNNRLYSESDIKRILRVKELIHEHGFTLACLRLFFASAPCWIVYRCKESDECPVRNLPDQRCFEVIQTVKDKNKLETCQQCPIYLNRNTQTMPLLDKS